MKVIESQEYLQKIKEIQSCSRRCICKAYSFDRIMTHCPSHDDNVPSLSVKAVAERSKPLLHCFAGCEFDSIYNALDSWGVWDND